MSLDSLDAATAPERLRALCLALPEVTERLSHGVAFWCAAPEGAQESLAAAYPERFFRPPYVGVRGWLGVYLDVPVDWDEIAAVIEDAYRVVAPKKLVGLLDAG
jgi:hypothetical protein